MMDGMSMWLHPALDVSVLALLGVVLWRLGGDPTTAWRAREEALQTIFGDLRALVAQSEGVARDLDRDLAVHAARIAELLAAAPTAPVRDGREREVAALAARGLASEDIARQVGMPAAEVRVLLGLQAVRLAARDGGRKGAADSAA